MRFTYLYLENYIGIYNGMNLHKIEINLSLCRHKMLIIRGENGSGKSTIFNSMSVFPDSNDMFIPGLAASKIIHLQDGINIYQIMFVHPVKADGSRDTTKAYISKIVNGQSIELNPNGNVTSYKDIIYDELGLDPNFIALSQLSMDDKGLASKKPAERKRFVNAIMSSLEVYNNIHKTLTKQSNAIKAVMNTISTKLGNLGDIGILQANLKAIEGQINSYNTQKDEATRELMKYKAQKDLIDPDGSIQSKYNTLSSQVAADDKSLRSKLERYCNRYNESVFDLDYSYENVQAAIIETQEYIRSSQSKIEDIVKGNKDIQDKIKELRQQETEKNNTISNLSSEESFEDLCDRLANARAEIDDLKDKLKDTGIEPGSINRDEYILALNTLMSIKAAINSLKDHNDYQVLEEVMREARDKYPLSLEDVSRYQRYVDNYVVESPKLNEDIRRCDSDIEKLKSLQFRPESCIDDTCPFISDLIAISKVNPAEERKRKARELEELQVCYENAKLQIDRLTTKNRCIGELNNVLRLVSINGNILIKLPHGRMYENVITFIDALMSNEDFTYIDELYKYINLANYFDEYNATKKVYDELMQKYDLYSSKADIIEQLKSELTKISDSIGRYTAQYENQQKDIKALQDSIEAWSFDLNKLSKKLEELDLMVKLRDAIKENRDSMSVLLDSMAKIHSCNELMDVYASKIRGYTSQLEPLLKDRDKINHSIQLANDYQQELETIRQQYDLIETIKYYSSPTTGIQLVFMELYMGKIIGLANELLANLFNGEYVIQPFIINESEFRIPCLGSGYLNDDISSMSSAQISMISMILSFALLYNSSTKYNIIKLDEIDGPLDENNRILFTDVLNRIMVIMNTEQCVLISHNSELNVDNSDVIVLKSRNLSSEYTRGNIIWKY